MIAAHEKQIAELEQAVATLTAEKAAIQSELDVLTGTTPRYEAIPVEPPSVGPGRSQPALPGSESSERPA